MSEIKVRSLKRKDRKTISDLLQKFAEKIGNDQLKNIIDSSVSTGDKELTVEQKESANQKMLEFAINLLKQIFDILDNDVKPFLADLVGCTVDEFDDQSFDVEIQILNQLVEKPEFSSFFTGASQLFKKMKPSGNG